MTHVSLMTMHGKNYLLMPKICLVACSRTKASHSGAARALYTSPLFKKASEYASHEFDKWFILSAKYGLLSPETLVRPYDKTLNSLTHVQRLNWSKAVFRSLQKILIPGDEITFVAGQNYREFLVPLLEAAGYRITVPLAGKSIGNQLKWLNASAAERMHRLDLGKFYQLMESLRVGLSDFHTLRSRETLKLLPRKGVYFFFELGEMRRGNSSLRVVRVGTHAVSRGSKSSLRDRLRTHRGLIQGGGNHRSSIFRLHLGLALKEHSSLHSFSFWGKGQSATREITTAERELEAEVSRHIQDMPFLWIAVDDDSGPASDRSYIERNAIALISNLLAPLDPPSDKWLGLWHPNELIRRSGLWNLNYVNDVYDRRFLEVLSVYVEATLGKRAMPETSLNPQVNRKKLLTTSQLRLF